MSLLQIDTVLIESGEPLATKEVEEKVRKSCGNVSRAKVLYRLNDLRGVDVISGKFVASGNGVWIWWKKQASGKSK